MQGFPNTFGLDVSVETLKVFSAGPRHVREGITDFVTLSRTGDDAVQSKDGVDPV